MRVLLLAPTTLDHVALRAALGAALGATSLDTCHTTEAAVTWLENRPCDLVGIAGAGPGVADAVDRLRRTSRTLPLLAIVDDVASRDAGLAWLAGADGVVALAALSGSTVPDGLDDVRRQDRDALRRTQRVWYAGPSDALRQHLTTRLGSRLRDVGLSGEGLAGLTTQDVETPQSAALVVNALGDPAPFVLGVRRVKRTYPALAVIVVTDGVHHDAFRRAGADECLSGQPDVDHLLHAVGRAQASCRGVQELDAVRARETRLRSLLENLPEAVVLVSPEHSVLAVNLAALRLLGAQDARQVLGAALAPWLEPEDADPSGLAALVDSVTAGATRELVVRTRHLADPRRIHVRAVPFQRESGGSPAALVVLRDVASSALAQPGHDAVASGEPALEPQAWLDARAADAARIEELEQALASANAEGSRLATVAAEVELLRAAAVQASALQTQLEASRLEVERLQAFEFDLRTAAARIGELETALEASREDAARTTLLERQLESTRAEAAALHEALDQARAEAARVVPLEHAVEAARAVHDDVGPLRERVRMLERIEAEDVPALHALVEELRGRDAAARQHADETGRHLAAAAARVDDLERTVTILTAEKADLEAAVQAATAAEPTAPAAAAVADHPVLTAAAPTEHQWLLEHVAGVGVITVRRDGQIAEANAQAARLCGFETANQLRDAGELPEPLLAVAGDDPSLPSKFELCLQLDGDTAPVWVAGARLPAADDTGLVTWWLADASDRHTGALPSRERPETFSAVLEVATAEWTALVSAAADRPRGPRPVEQLRDGEAPADRRALARAQVMLSQLSSMGRRRGPRHAAVDLSAHLTDLAPVLQRLTGADLDWRLSVPETPVHACVPPGDLERCVTALVAGVRDALPLGGQLSLALDHGPDGCTGPDGVVRADVVCVLEAQGYGLTSVNVPAAARELAAGLGAEVGIETVDSLTARVTLRLPRAFVVTHAA